MKLSRIKTIDILFFCILLGLSSYLVLKFVRPFGLGTREIREMLLWEIKEILKIFITVFFRVFFYITNHFKSIFLTIPFWMALIFTLIMEQIMLAKPNQKNLSPGFFQDLVWFFYETILDMVITLTYVAFLRWSYGLYFSELTITQVDQLPKWIKFVFALLLFDFLYWFQHFLHHKVPLLWEFHKVHHSQMELNFFTDFRYHIFEYIVRYTFVVIPFLIFKFDPPEIVAFTLFHSWYSRFYHGNIKTNLGPLCYLLVTPQSHRVHHSIEKRHFDKNFGDLFTIWDFIFRTQYTGFNEYPDAGINDSTFPHEKTGDIRKLLLTPLHQLIYPFKTIKKSYSEN